MAPKAVKLLATQESVGDEPVSPTGQYFNSSVLSVCVLAVFESDVPIDDSPAFSTLENLFLPVTPRFSSIMVRDGNGTKYWKQVDVNLQDHVIVPVFPPGLESYDDHVRDYLSEIAGSQFSQTRPLWELHIIKYPTRVAEGMMVFKLHHALGDGFSLMGALFSCVKRADDPSLPLTFPTSKTSPLPEIRWWRRVPLAMSVCVNTMREFGWSLLKSNFLVDDRTPIRSGEDGVELHPVVISSVTFSLDDVSKIKAQIGGTVNDVICGIVFHGTQLYMQAAGKEKGSAEVTALVLLNTRVIGSYQNLQEMTRADSKSPWGNQFGFLHVSIPHSENADEADPLDLVVKARQIIKAKRSSLAVYLTGRVLETLRKILGPEVTARYIHQTLKNTSMTISNLTGPIEQMIIAGHPVRSLYFMVVGIPQSLTITVFSYMGKLIVAVGAEKGFINSDLLISCMQKSFQRIFDAAVGKRA